MREVDAQGWPLPGALIQRLVEAGYEIAPSELADERPGPTTIAAVRAFQQAAGLKVDGLPGPKTWRALTGYAPHKFTDDGWRWDSTACRPCVVEVVRGAVGDIGVVEDPPGSNRGPRPYMRGVPWCAYAVSHWYMRSEPPSPFGTIGSARGIYQWGATRDRVETDPIPGDVGVILRGPVHGHVGLVAHVLPDGRVATVEGNSSNACRGRVRERSAFHFYVRPIPV